MKWIRGVPNSRCKSPIIMKKAWFIPFTIGIILRRVTFVGKEIYEIMSRIPSHIGDRWSFPNWQTACDFLIFLERLRNLFCYDKEKRDIKGNFLWHLSVYEAICARFILDKGTWYDKIK